MRGVALLALVACGAPAPPDLVAQLSDLPGVTVAAAPTTTAGARYFVLHFTQPVDHTNPDGPTFQQEVSLLDFGDEAAPLVVETDGYGDYTLDSPVELTRMLGANQISIEHRFFAPSRPEPADWSDDAIVQMAADEHAIVAALRSIYAGPAIATGASKGGMTAVFYRRFFPDDVVATVPYVAPISYGAPDPRYDHVFDDVGPADGACRQAIRDAATDMLANRRDAITTRALAQAHSYTRIPIGPAVEVAIQSLEWSFWQYFGVDDCGMIPPATATDDDMFAFLDQVSPVSASDDDQCADFEGYVYQAFTQLGWAAPSTPYLTSLQMYDNADYYDGGLPLGTSPTYDGGAAMHDIATFVETQGARLLFVYGQWDPWSGGEYALGSATDSLLLVEPQGTHGSDIAHLAPADRDAALAKLAAWTGVSPIVPDAARRRMLRVPPLLR